MRLDRTFGLRAASLGAAAALGAAATLPAVRWEPLHLDEAIMLDFSRRSLWSIVQDVFVDRGGAPAQFFVEHATLAWPGGIEGLRVPSLLFFLFSLPLAAAVGRRLLGETAGLLLPLLLALAPLAVELATFGRMYALFLLCVLGATWLGIEAATRGGARAWAVAGAAAGLLVYVHPIAPLYAPLALLTGLAVRPRPWRAALRELRPALVAAGVAALPYVYALAILRSRYHVGEAARLRTTAGRSIPEESLHALSPAGTGGAVLLALLALAGLVWLARDRRPVAVALAAWLAVPVGFFALVPAETRFFGRYLVPALPMFLLLVLAGCFAVVRLMRLPGTAALVLVAALLVLEASEDADRLRTLRRLSLPDLAAAVDPADVLFSSTGSPRADRPPELLDDYAALERPVAVRVEELPAIDPRFERDLLAKGSRRVTAFLQADGPPRRGAWIFRGRPRRVDALVRRLDGAYETGRISRELVLVRSPRPAGARELVRQALAVRTSWGLTTPADRWPRQIAAVDRASRASR